LLFQTLLTLLRGMTHESLTVLSTKKGGNRFW
jgi:hypothetical protein